MSIIPFSSSYYLRPHSSSQSQESCEHVNQVSTYHQTPHTYLRSIFEGRVHAIRNVFQLIQINPLWKQVVPNIVHNTLSVSLNQRLTSTIQANTTSLASSWTRPIIKAYLEWNTDLKRYYFIDHMMMKNILKQFIPQEILTRTKTRPILEKWLDNISKNVSTTFGYMFDTRFARIDQPRKRVTVENLIHSIMHRLLSKGKINQDAFNEFVRKKKLYYPSMSNSIGNEFIHSIYPLKLEGKNIEVIDVDVSIRYSIILSLKSDFSESNKDGIGTDLVFDFDSMRSSAHQAGKQFGIQCSNGTMMYKLHEANRQEFQINPCFDFDEIKRRYIQTRKDRKKFILESTRMGVNYSLYAQNDYGHFTLIAESRNQRFSDLTGTFENYLKMPVVEEIDAIGNMNINELLNSPQLPMETRYSLKKWEKFPVRIALRNHLYGNKVIQDLTEKSPTNYAPVFSSDDSTSLIPFVESTAFIPITWLDRHNFRSQRTEKAVFDFIEGSTNLSSLGITKENAQKFLNVVKTIDLAFLKDNIFCVNSTFEIRCRILEFGPRNLTTCEVFTNTLSPAKFNNFNYLADIRNWINERVGFQAQLIMNHNLLSRTLSQRLKPMIFATRGNTGVGKTFWMSELLKEYQDNNRHLLNGVLNPDRIKEILKKYAYKGLLNSQVYAEGRVMFERFLETLRHKLSGIQHAIVDTRLLTLDEFEVLLQISKLRKIKLQIVDIDGPIWNSVISVLHREPLDQDPCVPFAVIRDGFCAARRFRTEFINRSLKANVHYSLYLMDEAGRQTHVIEGNEIKDRNALEFCLQQPSQEEMDVMGQTLITQNWINSLQCKGKNILENWIGHTVQDALDMHSIGKIIPSPV